MGKRRTAKRTIRSRATVIDAHQHVFWHGYDDRAVVENMDAHGIDVTWLLTWEIPPDYEREAIAHFAASLDPRTGVLTLEAVIEAHRRYPDRFVPFFAPHPKDPASLDRLKMAVRIFEVRGCGEWKFRAPLDDPDCLRIFHYCGDEGLPVVLHLDVPWRPYADRSSFDRWWYGGTIENLARALEACPQTVFLAHGPGFWREISGDAPTRPEAYPEGPIVAGGRLRPLMERRANLYCDMSAGSCRRALGRDLAYSRRLVCDFPDRFLFGRDNFDDGLMKLIGRLRLPKAVREKVLFKNALRLVPL